MANGGNLDPKEVLRDPDFLRLPVTERRKVMVAIDPKYRALPPGEQVRVLQLTDPIYQRQQGRSPETLIRELDIRAPRPEHFGERFAHAAGLPAHIGEVPAIVQGMTHPEPSPTSPGYGQTLPLVGPAFRAQRETFDQPGAAAKVYGGSIPLIGPPGYQMGKALERKDYASTLGSLVNIITQLAGMKAGLRGPTPGTVESALKSAGAASKPVIPYEPGATVSPAAKFTGGPRGSIARMITKELGLRPDYAETVAKRVEEIDSTRQQAESLARGVETKEREAGAALGRVREMTVKNIEASLDKSEATINARLEALSQKKINLTKGLVADTAKAVFEEQARVRQPFIEIGEKIEGPLVSGETVRGIIQKEATEAGVKPGEVPSSAYRAIPGARGGIDVGGTEGIVPAGFAPADANITFNDLTRIREDLYKTAAGSGDKVVSRALYNAAEKLDAIQEGWAQKAGEGEKYGRAKAQYKEFIRGIGSGVVKDWLAAEDVQAQELAPKLRQLATNPSTRDALHTILKAVGISTKELDDTLAAIPAAKQELKDIAKQRTGGPKTELGGIERQFKEGQEELGTLFKERKGEIETAAGTRMKELEQSGGSIVPGKGITELRGFTNEQLNRQRMTTLMDKMRSHGVTDPYVMLHVGGGVAAAATGHPYGAIYGFSYGLPAPCSPSCSRVMHFRIG